MITYRIRYTGIFLVLLLVEILIGTFLDSGFIRDYGGDILVLPVVYFLIRIFWARPSKANSLILPGMLFLLGAFAELLQAIDLTGILGIDKRSLLGILIGSVCDPMDMLCYAAGVCIVYIYLFFEKRLSKEA